MSSMNQEYEARDRAVYVLELWNSNLQIVCSDAAGDFFSLGGNSMGLVRMLVLIQRQFRREFDFDPFIINPTLDVLLSIVAQNGASVPRL
jgi:hypothetical protein